jgi:signal transduction histidine kinase
MLTAGPSSFSSDDLFERSPTGIIVCQAVRDEHGTLLDFQGTRVNAAAARLLGIPRELFLTASFLATQPEARESGLFDYYRAVTAGQAVPPMELFLNGHWYQGAAVQVGDGFMVTFINIDSTKAAHQQEAETRALLQRIVEATPWAVFLLDPVPGSAGPIRDFVIRMHNPAAEQLRAHTTAPLDGSTLREQFPQVHTPALIAAYASVLETDQPFRTDISLGSGEDLRWYHLLVVRQGRSLLLTQTDITDTRREQQHIEGQARLLDQVIDNTQAGIVLYEVIRDEAGNIIDFWYRLSNARNSDVTRLPRTAIEGRRMSEVFPSTMQTGFFEEVRKAALAGQPHRFEMEYRGDTIDGWFDLSLVPLGAERVLFTFVDISAQRRAERAARQQARAFVEVINASLNGILLISPLLDDGGTIIDFKTTLFNHAAQHLTGIPGSYATTHTLLAMDPNIGTSGLLQAAAEVLRTGDPLRVEFFFEPKQCWFDVSVSRLGNELVVTFSDVTAVRESVLERQQHAATLETLLTGSINGILACEAIRDARGHIVDFRILASNKAVETVLNIDPGKLINSTLLRVYPDHIMRGVFARYTETVETGKAHRFEFDYVIDNQSRWLDISTIKQGDGLVISFIDITEAKVAQQALIGESTLFQTLSSHVPQMGVLVVNPSGRILFANGDLPAFFRSADQGLLPDQRLADALLPALRQELFEPFRTALNGQSSQVSVQIGEGYYESYYSPVENAEGQVVMAMATFRDVTLDRLYQQQLKQSNENLERFAYVASHDLQEPLRKIQAFGDMLYRKQAEALDEASVGYIRRMQAAASRMTDLIGDLLTYSRVSSKPLEFEPVELAAVLRAVRSDLDLVIREKAAQLIIDPLPILTGDATQLRQLVQNLLSNALKFSRPAVPPRVEIRYRTVPASVVPFGGEAAPDTDFHELSFVDNGIGFEPQYADRIFEAFQRLHGRSEYPGTGIGLAIVRKVVENHHGLITVDSTPGQGSTFRVYLPGAI